MDIARLIAINAMLAIAVYLPLSTGRMVVCLGAVMAAAGIVSAWLVGSGLASFNGSLAAAALFGGGFLVAIGFAFRHLSGLPFAIATLSVGEVLRTVVTNVPQLGGATGYPVSAATTVIMSPFVILGALAAVMLWFESTPLRCAIRQLDVDRRVAQAQGVHPVRVDLGLLAASGAIAGIAGALYAHTVGIIEPDLWGFQNSITILLYGVLGGTGAFVGPIVAAGVLGWAMEFLRISPTFRLGFYGLVMVAGAVLMPAGLMPGRPRRNLHGRLAAWRRRVVRPSAT